VTTVERIDRHLDAHDDLLSDMLQVHMTQVSVRQNEDMRKISACAGRGGRTCLPGLDGGSSTGVARGATHALTVAAAPGGSARAVTPQ
ncbi:hypothetical protein ACWFNS_15945, partial [Oerskovia enterophila]